MLCPQANGKLNEPGELQREQRLVSELIIQETGSYLMPFMPLLNLLD